MKEEHPCRYCVPPKRTVTCHSTCPEWAKHEKEKSDRLSKIYKNKESDVIYIGYMAAQARKKH